MKHGVLSDRIRERAIQRYVIPALEGGRERCSIRVKELMHELEAEGFPRDHQAQFCSALQAKTFLLEHGLEIERIDGPASKKSTTVVFHYRVKRNGRVGQASGVQASSVLEAKEDPAAKADRLTEALRGLLKDELAAYGGAEAFMRWMRSDEENVG